MYAFTLSHVFPSLFSARASPLNNQLSPRVREATFNAKVTVCTIMPVPWLYCVLSLLNWVSERRKHSFSAKPFPGQLFSPFL